MQPWAYSPFAAHAFLGGEPPSPVSGMRMVREFTWRESSPGRTAAQRTCCGKSNALGPLSLHPGDADMHIYCMAPSRTPTALKLAERACPTQSRLLTHSVPFLRCRTRC